MALHGAALPAQAFDPVNGFKVIAIDAKGATVTACDNKTGNISKFKVNDRWILKAVKVGDAGQSGAS
jgi:hypothetical protein